MKLPMFAIGLFLFSFIYSGCSQQAKSISTNRYKVSDVERVILPYLQGKNVIVSQADEKVLVDILNTLPYKDLGTLPVQHHMSPEDVARANAGIKPQPGIYVQMKDGFVFEIYPSTSSEDAQLDDLLMNTGKMVKLPNPKAFSRLLTVGKNK